MAGYQHTIIIGNVGGDPDLRYTKNGVAVCNFSVAVSRRWTDKTSNESREETTWFRVSAWRRLAETMAQYVHKGMPVMVTGRLSASAYIGKDGEAHASLELTATEVQFLGRKGEAYATPGQDEPKPVEENSDIEDLPF